MRILMIVAIIVVAILLGRCISEARASSFFLTFSNPNQKLFWRFDEIDATHHRSRSV